MKKTMMALLLMAAGGVVHAQASVTVYGVLDSGLVLEGGGKNGNVTKVSGGAAAGSRLGFRGKEDLGGGMSASFVLESGINVDDGSLNAGGGLFGRQAFIGLHGGYGSVTMGRQYSLIYQAVNEVADPFKTGSSGRANNVLQMAGTRINNSVRYTSPSFNGFNVNVQTAMGEVSGRAAAGRRFDAELAYAGGPWAGRMVYSTYNDAPASNFTALNRTRIGTAMGSYLFATRLKLHGGVAVNKDNVNLDSRDAIVGLTYFCGTNRLVGSVIEHDDRTAVNADVTQYAVGAYHGLSPRTELYFIFSKMRRENAAAEASFFVGNASDAGSGNRGVNIGIKHAF